MPRIDFTAPLEATDADDSPVLDWERLRAYVGRSFDESDIVAFFGQSPEELPIAVLLERMGDTRVLANDQQDALLAQSSVRASRTLTDGELETLQKHVAGQWSDGFGEGLELDGFCFSIDCERVEGRQVDDGVSSRGSGTRDLFPAIRAADIDRVRAALAADENVLAVIGGSSALGWALSFANAEIVHLLLDAGVDVHHRTGGFLTSLASCAISLDDAAAASVASRLLEQGGFEQHEIDYAVELAGEKQELAAVLDKYRS